MFVGRQKELKKLNELYQSNQFEFAVLYGRRRVGKTTLISEFIKDKKHIFYMSVEGTQKENLTGLSKAVLRSVNGPEGISYDSFSALLDAIDDLCKKQTDRMILAIDEYPYLAASYPAISSMLQSHIDQCWKNSHLFLILCGSSMSFMEEQVLGYKSPLYGRRTVQFKVKPFTYFESRDMLCEYSAEDQAVFYGVTGGIPEYLARINKNLTLDQNIKQLFFEESGRLFEEPVNLLKQELKDPSSYHSIISAIAGGASKMNEIATKTGLESSGCSNQITSLIALGIVRKEIPVTEKETSRKTLYRLEDSMFLFWYRFVRPNISGISMGIGESIYDHMVKPQISDFMGLIFEEICRQYLFLPNIYVNGPFLFGKVGKWWGTDPVKKKQEEIDLAAIGDDQILLGECKWKHAKVNTEVLETLRRRGELFHYTDKYYYVFSKTGFEDAAITYGQVHGMHLIDFCEMNNI